MNIYTTLIFLISPCEVLLVKSCDGRIANWQYRYEEDSAKEAYLTAHPEFKDYNLYVNFVDIEVGYGANEQITDYREYKDYLEMVGGSEIEWLDDEIFKLQMDKQNISKESSLFCSYFPVDIRRGVGSHINEDSECREYVHWLEKIVIEYRDQCLDHLNAIKYLLDRHPDHIADVSKMIQSWNSHKGEEK